jgi:hypothetical protein
MKDELRRLAVLLALSSTLSGCYESDFPLGPVAEASIDPRFLGSWRCVQVEQNESAAMVLTALPFDEKQYYVGLAAEGEATLHYRAYGTTVKGTALLNIQELEPDRQPAERKWSFVRPSLLKPNVLQVEIVREEPFQNVEPSAKAVREIVERMQGSPELYEEYCVCARVIEQEK